MDTTLRDGEQTSGVSFVPHEKLMIARMLLEDLKVDRLEVASARVSDGEMEAVRMICEWAATRNHLHKVEVNLPEQTITNQATGKSEHFEINAYKKHCLMNGLDDIDFLVANKDKIEAWENASR